MTPFKQAQTGFIAIRVAHAKDHRITHRASNSSCNAALLDTEVDPAHRARLMKQLGQSVREIEAVVEQERGPPRLIPAGKSDGPA